MQNISNICERIGLNLLPSQQFPQSFISASIKGNASISTLLPPLNNYGYYLHPSNLIEPVSPGCSSPCYSDHNENDPPCIEREHEYTLHEIGRMFMDSLAVGDTALPPDTAASVWLLVHGLHEKHYIEEFLALMRAALNPKFKNVRIVNYRGKQSLLLEFFDVHSTQMVFMCLKNDTTLKAFMHLDWHVLTLYIKSQEFSQLPPFNGVVVTNLPVACTVNTIKGLIQAHCPGAVSIHVEMPVVIGEAFCTLIRTPSLEDAELICLGLNALPTRTGQLKAALHPDCDIRHTDPSKDPFYELKSSHRSFFPFQNPIIYNHPPDPRFQYQFHHQPHPHQYHQSYQEESSFVRKPISDRRGGNYGPPRDDYHWQRREETHNVPNGLSHKEAGRILQHENFKRHSGRFSQHENNKRDYRSERSTASRHSKSSRHPIMQEPYDPDSQESKHRYMQATYNTPYKSNHHRAPYNPYLNPNPDEKIVYPEIEAKEVADYFKPVKERTKSSHPAEAKISDPPKDSILIKEESSMTVNFRRESNSKLTAQGIFKYGDNEEVNKNDANQWSDLWTKTWHHKPEQPQKQPSDVVPPIKDLLDQHSQYHSQSATLQDNIQKVSEMVTPSGKYTVVTQIFKSEEGEEFLPEKVKSQLPYQRYNSVQMKPQISKNSAIEEKESSGQSFLRRSHSDTYTEHPSSKYHSLDFIPPHHPVLMGDRKVSMELERGSSIHRKTALKKQTSFLTSPSVGQYHSDEDEQDPNISVVIQEVNSDRSGSDNEMKNWKSVNFEIFIDAGSQIQEEPQKGKAEPTKVEEEEPYIIPKTSRQPKPLVLTETLRATQQQPQPLYKEFFNTTPKQTESKAEPHKKTPKEPLQTIQVQKNLPQGFIPFNDRLIFSTKSDTVIPVQTKPPPPSFTTQTIPLTTAATLPLQDSLPVSQKNTQSAQIKDPRLKLQVKQEEQHKAHDKPEMTPKPTMEIEQNKSALEKDPRLKLKVKQLEEEQPKTIEKPALNQIPVKQEPVIEPLPLLEVNQEPTIESPAKPLSGASIVPKLEASQESTTEPSPKLLSGVVLMPRLELNKESSYELLKKKKSRFTDKIEEFKSEGPKSPNVETMQVESTLVSSIKKKPSRFSTSLSSDSVSTEATQSLSITENPTKMIEEPKNVIDLLPPPVEIKQEPNFAADSTDALEKLNSHLLNFISNQSTPVDKENSTPATPDKGNSILMPPPCLSTRKENEHFNSAMNQIKETETHISEPLHMNPPSGGKSLDEIYRQFCEEEDIKEGAETQDNKIPTEIEEKLPPGQPEETPLQPSTPQNIIEDLPKPVTEESSKEEPAVPMKVVLRKSKFTSAPSPPRVRNLMLEKEVAQEVSEKASSLEIHQEISSPTNHLDSDKKQDSSLGRFIPGSIFIERKEKSFQNGNPEFASGKREKKLFAQKQDDQIMSLNHKRSRDELLPPPSSKRTLPKGYTWKRTKTPQAFLALIDNNTLLSLSLSQSLMGQPQDILDPIMRPPLPQESIQNLLFPEIPTFLSYSHSNQPAPAFYDPEKPSGEFASSDLQIEEIPQPHHQMKSVPAFYDPEKPSNEFSSGGFKSNDQTKQISALYEPEKPGGEFSSNDQQIREIPQSNDEKKLMAEYWDLKKALGLEEEQDEDQMSVEPEGTPPMLPEEGSPEGPPPMIPEEGSPEGTPPMLPEEPEEELPEGTPPMLPEGSPGYDDEAIGEDEDPEPTKKVIRDGVDFNALEIHHRENPEDDKMFEYLS